MPVTSWVTCSFTAGNMRLPYSVCKVFTEHLRHNMSSVNVTLRVTTLYVVLVYEGLVS